ncbi:MAG: anhydro-N-acetylmuramic acid kinase [Bacteroidales bacterium]
MASFNVIGLMSGTSLDGVDLLHTLFVQDSSMNWSFSMKESITIPYSTQWQNRLKQAPHLSGLELSLLNVDYGHLLGIHIRDFIRGYNPKPDFAAVHGHTIFHQPEKRLTLQIGEGSAIAAECGIPIIHEFRNKDVALGGQGAPLVPIGDHFLFPNYDYCLNLGGIANISYKNEKQERIAFDISPCNMALNFLSRKLGYSYDAEGNFARKGIIIDSVLQDLNHLSFYKKTAPKSLGAEWYESSFFPIINTYLSEQKHQSPEIFYNLLRTVSEHIAMQIAAICHTSKSDLSPSKEFESTEKQMLVTGGGAFNTFLMDRIRTLSSIHIAEHIDPLIINYKEALIFSFLGILRYTGQENCLRSVTGATIDNIGGAVYL